MPAVRELALTLARLLTAAWVGAAVLFTINLIRMARLVPRELMTPQTFDQLAVLRFNTYYLFGFVCIGLSSLLLLAAPSLRRRWFAFGLLALALVVMVVDYQLVYTPLVDTLGGVNTARPARFTSMHRRSEQINTVHVGLCLVASLILNWPVRAGSQQPIAIDHQSTHER